MKPALKWFGLALFCLTINVAFAQRPENVTVNNDDFGDFTGTGTTTTTTTNNSNKANTPSSGTTTKPQQGPTVKVEPTENKGELPPDPDAPLDGIVERKTILEKQVLPWEPVRESDIMWSKRVWRVIDVREKMNLPFVYPEEPFINILLAGVKDTVSGIKAYKSDNDKFKYKLSADEVKLIGSRVDSIEKLDPVTYETRVVVTVSNLNPEDVKRFRVKEDWYFDKQYSTLKVRILGIAPLKDVTDDAGNFLYEQPLFWVRYPDCREYLARHKVFIEGNDSNPMSWEDLFEMRRFSSYVWKESNVYNRRLQDYLEANDRLLEGEKIKKEIFSFEHDLWTN